MWTKYLVRWDFMTQLCGSVPANPEIVKAWLDAQKPKVRPPASRSIQEITEEVLSTLAEPEEELQGNILTFQRKDGVLVMRAATVKAHIKDCARVLSNQYIGRIAKERAFSTRVINGVYPDPTTYWIPILRQETGEPVRQHDGERDKAVHIHGQTGALKRFEFIENAQLEFWLWVLTAKGNKPSVSRTDLETLFLYGGVHGYAGERSDGEGRYHASILKEDTDADHSGPTGPGTHDVQVADD